MKTWVHYVDLLKFVRQEWNQGRPAYIKNIRKFVEGCKNVQ